MTGKTITMSWYSICSTRKFNNGFETREKLPITKVTRIVQAFVYIYINNMTKFYFTKNFSVNS